MPFNFTRDDALKAQKGPEPIPNGVYTVEVESCEESFTINQNEQYTFVLRIIDDPEFTGRRIWQRMYNTEKAAWRLQKALMALTANQWNPEDYPDGESLKGLACRVITKAETGTDGIDRPKVESWLALAEDAQSDTQGAKASIAAGKKSRANAL